MKKTQSLTVNERRRLEARRAELVPIVEQYEGNGITDTVYHEELYRLDAALEADRKGQHMKRGKEK